MIHKPYHYSKYFPVLIGYRSIGMLIGNFTKSQKVSLHQLNFKTNDLSFVVKDFEGTETVSCHLLLRMAWMEMD